MSAVELKPVYLITGSDRPKVERAVERLRRHFAAESTERVSAVEASGQEVVALCNMGGLFGDRRLVLVHEIGGRRREDNRLSGGWKAADLEHVTGYVRAPAAGTVLALVAEDAKSESALAREVARIGDVLRFDVVKKKIESWIADRFRERGVHAEPDACKALVQIVGGDLQALASEIDKIAVWAGGEPVGEQEVASLAVPVADTVFQATDAWGRRDLSGLLRSVESYVERSGRPPSASIPILTGALVRQVGLVRRARRLDEQGVKPREATKALGLRFDFQARNAYEFARNYGERDLDDALVRLAELDHALKGGSRLAADIELQRALVDIARPPGKPAHA